MDVAGVRARVRLPGWARVPGWKRLPRWVRRVLGYGVGVLTSYERIRHNQHWLSDTVAGAALGTSTAFFTMHRRYPADTDGGPSGLSVQPVSGGVMLSYNMQL